MDYNIIIPVGTFLLGYLLNYGYQVLLEKDRIRKVKKYLFFSLKLLEKSTTNQIVYIKDFINQFNNKTSQLKTIRLEQDFHLENINTISKEDVFKILIVDSNLDEKKKTEIYSAYNFAMIAIKKAVTHLESDMLTFFKEQEQYLLKLNQYAHEIRNAINELTLLKRQGSLPLRQVEFQEKILELYIPYLKEYEKKEEDNIFKRVEKLYAPIFNLTKEYENYYMLNLLPEFFNLYNNYEQKRLGIVTNYNQFILELEYAITSLKKVHS